MTTFAVIRKADQVEVHRYDAEAAVAGDYPLDTFDHLGLSYAALNTTRITRLAFFSRFTDPEAITIDLASQGATVPAASMRRYMQKVNAAEHVDLAREETRGGVQSLEQGGALAAGRAAAILDAPAKVHEIFDRHLLDLPPYSISEPEIVPEGVATVYLIGQSFVTVAEGDAPEGYAQAWPINAFQARMIELGAELAQVQGALQITYTATV